MHPKVYINKQSPPPPNWVGSLAMYWQLGIYTHKDIFFSLCTLFLSNSTHLFQMASRLLSPVVKFSILVSHMLIPSIITKSMTNGLYTGQSFPEKQTQKNGEEERERDLRF